MCATDKQTGSNDQNSASTLLRTHPLNCALDWLTRKHQELKKTTAPLPALLASYITFKYPEKERLLPPLHEDYYPSSLANLASTSGSAYAVAAEGGTSTSAKTVAKQGLNLTAIHQRVTKKRNSAHNITKSATLFTFQEYARLSHSRRTTSTLDLAKTLQLLLILISNHALVSANAASSSAATQVCWEGGKTNGNKACVKVFGLHYDYSIAEGKAKREVEGQKNWPYFWEEKQPEPFQVTRWNNQISVPEFDAKKRANLDKVPRLSLMGDLSELSKKPEVVKDEQGNDRTIYADIFLRWVRSDQGKPGEDCFHSDRNSEVTVSRGHGLEIGTFEMVFAESTEFEVDDPDLKYQPHQACLCLNTTGRQNCKYIANAEYSSFYLFRDDALPTYITASLVIALLCLSGLFSGLNLGLMALDPTELKALKNVGDFQEKRYAAKIEPVRKRGNFLLCTLLLGNTLVNATLAIFLGDLFQGPMALVFSTFGIVTFGEIIPQSICSRHGLRVGANTVIMTKIFMVLTFPLSWPISKLLDLVLGQEIGAVIKKKELLELIKQTEAVNDLEDDEMAMIQGALELSTKEVKSVMTKISDCFMLEKSINLDFKTIADIIETGYTRIPVYEDQRTNIVGLLFVKDLAFVDPDDCTPLKVICEFYSHEVRYVAHSVKLDNLLEDFRQGAYHLAIVYDDDDIKLRGGSDSHDGGEDSLPVPKVSDSIGDGSSLHSTNRKGKYTAIGIVTLEDVIEELIKGEIVDETDRYKDNRGYELNELRHKTINHKELVSVINQQSNIAMHNDDQDKEAAITPQLFLAAHRFLVTEIQAFRYLKQDSVLKMLRHADVLQVLTDSDIKRDPEKAVLMTIGEPSNFFILILEGHCNVRVGKDAMLFDNGPFSHFGHKGLQQVFTADAPLTQSNKDIGNLQHRDTGADIWQLKESIPNFTPDFTLTVKEDEDKLVYLKITRDLFIDYLKKDKTFAMKLDTAEGVVKTHKELEIRLRSGTNPQGTTPSGTVVVSPMNTINTGLNHVAVRTISGNPNAIAPMPAGIATPPGAVINKNVNQNNNHMSSSAYYANTKPKQILARSRPPSNSESCIYDAILKDKEASPLVSKNNDTNV